MRGVDLETFRFDYDLTFAVLMMDGAGNVYSRFGTREDGPAHFFFFGTLTKTARVLASAVIGTEQTGLAPLHAPVQALRRQPLAGVALKVSAWKDGTESEQRVAQTNPAGAARTLPLPETCTSSLNVAAPKTAVTLADCARLTKHGPEPVHAPVQRTKREPGDAVALRVTCVPPFQVDVHEALQLTPGASLATAPGPSIVSASWTCRSSATSHGES